VTDASGAVLERVYYSDAFGTPTFKDASGTTLVGTSTGTRFLFTGREWLAALSLYDYRNRTYSAELGRFIETDPIGFEAGDENLYRYVANNGVNWTDPLGLATAGSLSTSGALALAEIAAMEAGGTVSPLASAAISGAAAAAAVEVCKQPKKDPCKGLRDQLEAHQKKLSEYMQNPDGFDNKGVLKNASPELRQKIIDGRVRNLQEQIANFAKQLAECLEKNGV
jgi:RHS repeat-associated protein